MKAHNTITAGVKTNGRQGDVLNFGTIRPQIFLAILCATAFSIFVSWVGMQLQAVEIITGTLGALMGFLGGVSLKVLEGE